MIEFAETQVTAELIEEIKPLTKLHWAELGEFDVELKPNFEGYQTMSRAGAIKVFTARNGRQLVGYNVFFISRSMHHNEVKHAAQDVLFLHPELRGKGHGRDFLTWCDEQLKQCGVRIIYQTVKAKSDHGKLLTAMGYEKVDITYGRHL